MDGGVPFALLDEFAGDGWLFGALDELPAKRAMSLAINPNAIA